MPRLRPALGLAAAVVITLSSAAHSLMGWPALRAQLATASTPPDLVTGLGVGWNFAGAAMLAFGIILAHLFLGRLRGRDASLLPARVVAVLYLAFGLYAWSLAHDAFFLGVFVFPGVLLAIASFGDDRAHPGARPELDP